MMTGSGRLSGRGPAIAAERIPAVRLPSPLILPFRLVSVLAAQMFDFGTFTVMIGRHGVAAEMNPLISQGYSGFGMPLLAITKIALVILLTSIVVLLARDRPLRRSAPRLAAAVTVLAVLGGLIGGISNLTAG